VDYFEGIDSERGIAWRAADSFSFRKFLGYDLIESTPDHSTVSRRLGPDPWRGDEVGRADSAPKASKTPPTSRRRGWIGSARRRRPTTIGPIPTTLRGASRR